MSAQDRFELASVAIGPFDSDDEFYDYEGCALNERYMFFIDAGALWVRSVYQDPEQPRQYIDGESGGMAIGLDATGDIMDITTQLVARLRNMDALDFLTQVLLFTPGRGDFNLQLDGLITDRREPRG